MKNEVTGAAGTGCTACSGELRQVEAKASGFTYKCLACGGLIATHMYLGDSFAIVSPHFEEGAYDPSEERYFDITGVGSQGPYRRHGWYLPRTRRITQVG